MRGGPRASLALLAPAGIVGAGQLSRFKALEMLIIVRYNSLIIRYNALMTQITNELIYEVLKSVQAQVAITREDVAYIKARLTSLDTHLGALHTDMALVSSRMDRLEGHMARVDTRLNLADAE